MNETQNSEIRLEIKLVKPMNGKYYINCDTEVYVYPHLTLISFIFSKSGGELPSREEAIGKAIQPLYNSWLKLHPRLAPRTNGIILLDSTKEQKKEEAPHGKDLITTEETERIVLQPCRYIVSSGKNRLALEELFGDIF